MTAPRGTSGESAVRVLARRAAAWRAAALDLVYPPRCAACDAPLESGHLGQLCGECRAALVERGAACPRCAAAAGPAGSLCPHCRLLRPRFTAAVRLGSYAGELRTAVLKIKRPRDRALALALGDLLAECVRSAWPAPQAHAVVPIPMHWTRRWWRGVNSGETLGERVASRLGIPLAAHLLVRQRRTSPQASLSARKRRANVRGAFRARSHADLSGATILLVDDIMTTGATLNEAARTLLEAGAESVAVAVLARAEAPD